MKLEAVGNVDPIIKPTAEEEASLNNTSSSGPDGNSSQYTKEYDNVNLNLSNDVSELFNFFPNISDGPGCQLESNEKLDKQNIIRIDNKDDITSNSNKRKRDSELGKNEQRIQIKSSQNFPITDSLKDIILELDIGNSVSQLQIY